MPYEKREAETVYTPEEYPKMLTRKDKDGMIVPVYYPANHPNGGHPVIFENEKEEKAYFAPAKKFAPAVEDDD